MVELGAAGIGLVLGWLLPVSRVGGDRATATSAGILGLTGLFVGWTEGQTLAGIAVGAALAASYVHAAWMDELRRRYGARLREGG